MDTTKFQDLLLELQAGPEPGAPGDDAELPPDFPNPEEMIEEGADPQFVLYTTVQTQLLMMAAMLEDSGAVDAYHEAFEAGLEEYMPGFPPMSPVTDSLFHSWALCDLKFGADKDNIGQLATMMLSEVGMPAELRELCGKLVSSRMGIYETLDVLGEQLVVRELVTGCELLVDVPTGYLGEEGELRFVRLAPPAVHDAEYFTELTTPYILEGHSSDDWTRYLQSVMPESVVASEGAGSTQVEDRLAAVFKDDLGTMPWLEFVFQSYSGFAEDVIYLTGIPDAPASLPHSDGTVATNSSMNIPGELVRQAQTLGISILPPGTNGYENDEGFEISLTDAQRKAAAQLMPHLHDVFKPETKGRKRVSRPVEQWKELCQLIERKLVVEQGHGRTRFRNLRKAIDTALSGEETSRQNAGSIKRGSSVETPTIYRMRIDLRGVKPPIWRRIEISDCTLAKLHVAVQAAMGWTDSHLHEFLIDNNRYSIPNPFGDGDFGVLDSTNVWLSDVVSGEGTKLGYMYDFGDGWDHVIKVEAVEQADRSTEYPRCVTGKRNCPVEDCGGIWGYEELLEILADPNHPEYEERIEWCGEVNPEEFDAASTTQYMQSWFAAIEPSRRQASGNRRSIPADDDGHFEITANFFDDDGELDEDGFQAWSEHLQSEFLKSPEARGLPEGKAYGWTDCVLNYAIRFAGEMPTNMSVFDLKEILLDIIPRKVMAKPEDAESIVRELNAFFRFIEREYAVSNARNLADVLTDNAAKSLQKELSDDSNFGMAKTFSAAGKDGGFDMTTQAGLDEAMLAWNGNLPKLDGDAATNDSDFNDEEELGVVSTIRRDTPRIGRNDPCHCGSGRKYKKCCLQKDG